MKSLDKTVRALLSDNGLSVEYFGEGQRTLQEGECIVLGGTAVEELPPAGGKPFEVLVIRRVAAESPFMHGSAVRPLGSKVSIEVFHPSDLACLVSTMHVLAHALTNPSGPEVLDLVSAPSDRRLLHLIRTGITLVNEAGVEGWRRTLRLACLEHVLAITHTVEYVEHRASAEAALECGDLDMGAWMLTCSTRAMAAAVLAASGETNPDPRWTLTLLARHRDGLGIQVADPLRQLLLASPSTISEARAAMTTLDAALATVVDRLAPVSAINDFISAASRRSERPTAGGTHNLARWL